MGRKLVIVAAVLAAVMAAAVLWLNRPQYQISEYAGASETKPMDGVIFGLEAGRRDGAFEIRNQSEQYLVLDFQQRPIRVEVLREDGWHRLVSTKMVVIAPDVVSAGDTYSMEFRWRDLLGGALKPGSYRAVLYFGDGDRPAWDWFSVETEFRVE